MYEIEKGVPLTEGFGKYSFLSKMEVGDSFVYPWAEMERMSQALALHQKKNGTKFRTKKIDNESKRCWRIE